MNQNYLIDEVEEAWNRSDKRDASKEQIEFANREPEFEDLRRAYFGGYISGKRSMHFDTDIDSIFREISAERARQDELHPWDKLTIVGDTEKNRLYHESKADTISIINDDMESNGTASVSFLLQEELHEIFAETDPVKQETEAIQLAALAIKFVQWSRAKRTKEG